MRDAVLTILFITTLVNFILFVFMVFIGLKDRINLWFAFTVFFSFLLAGANLLLRLSDIIIFFKFSYAIAVFVATHALIWSLFFIGNRPSVRDIILIELLGLIGFLVTFAPYGFIDNIIKISEVAYQGDVGFLFYVYLGVLGSIFVVMIKGLLRARKLSTGTKSKQLQYILFGIICYFIIGSVFSMIAPAMGKADYAFLDTTASLVWILLTIYAIVKHHLFDVKVVIIEATTVLISLIVLIRFILSTGFFEYLVNGTLAFFTIFFGIFIAQVMLKDISSRKKLESLVLELQLANKKLLLLDTQKSEFISIASHQLRTPLTAIKGYTSLLMEGSFGKLSDEVLRPVSKIFQSSQKLVLLVQNYLTISKIEQGKLIYNFEEVNILDLIKSIENDISESFIEEGLTLKISVDRRKKYLVSIDRSKVKQALSNILTYVINNTKDGFVEIMINIIDNSVVRITISDNGEGYTKSEVRSIFKKIIVKQEGTVPGNTLYELFLTKEIINANKGKVWLMSEGIGYGSSFFIDLPLIKHK